ncbi:unnamed protein product [Pelagomonas calceolata]|uniref:RING-CH-type domain-containing protein n=1 Tax=Pelagomonas calceolata TaxID=35677 RepID=A0A8J2SPZ8_9STRA|nr:unnamed protein product [Pelagomonas calceolata]
MAELVAAVPSLLAADQADQHYADAVRTAVAACAEDTAGQTCYICYGEGDEDEGLVRGCSCRGENGFAHVSCLARQAQVAVERRSGPRFLRWYICGLCEQRYHGVARCALGWACWKTYVGRPEADETRKMAMTQLGNGLSSAGNNEDALSVKEAQLAMMRRLGAPEDQMLMVQSNLANSYQVLGRLEEALQLERDVYSGYLRLKGERDEETLIAANNHANLLILKHFEEAKALIRNTIPVARRVLGEGHRLTLKMKKIYAEVSYKNPDATLDDLREAVMTLEDAEPRAQRVFGSAHPLVEGIGISLRTARETLAARETS